MFPGSIGLDNPFSFNRRFSWEGKDSYSLRTRRAAAFLHGGSHGRQCPQNRLSLCGCGKKSCIYMRTHVHTHARWEWQELYKEGEPSRRPTPPRRLGQGLSTLLHFAFFCIFLVFVVWFIFMKSFAYWIILIYFIFSTDGFTCWENNIIHFVFNLTSVFLHKININYK